MDLRNGYALERWHVRATSSIPEWAFRISNGRDVMVVMPLVDSNGGVDKNRAVIIQGTANEVKTFVPVPVEDARHIGTTVRDVFEDRGDFSECGGGGEKGFITMPHVRQSISCKRTFLKYTRKAA